MPAIVLMEVRPYGLVPITPWDEEQKRQFPIGSQVRATLTKGKSLEMLSYYWQLVDFVAKGSGYEKTPLSDELLIRTGFVEKLIFKNGEVHAKPKSIAAMDHTELREYVDAASDLICRDYLADMTPGKLHQEVERMVGISYPDVRPTRRDDHGLRAEAEVDRRAA